LITTVGTREECLRDGQLGTISGTEECPYSFLRDRR
jgi:hypothetical protein